MERMVREAHWGWYTFVLTTGILAEKGKMACLDLAGSGKVTIGSDTAGLIPIGTFAETLTGDGVKKINVKLFEEITALWWDNDAGSLAADDIGKLAYIKDGATVTAAGNALAGFVLAIDPSKGVLVYSPLDALLVAANAPEPPAIP